LAGLTNGNAALPDVSSLNHLLDSNDAYQAPMVDFTSSHLHQGSQSFDIFGEWPFVFDQSHAFDMFDRSMQFDNLAAGGAPLHTLDI
jgi:hypothetical protein